MFTKRINLLSRAILAAFVVLLLRLAWLQIVCCRKYRGQSQRNAIKRTELAAFRGTIRSTLRHPVAAMVITLCVPVGGIALMPTLDVAFFPLADRDLFHF